MTDSKSIAPAAAAIVALVMALMVLAPAPAPSAQTSGEQHHILGASETDIRILGIRLRLRFGMDL